MKILAVSDRVENSLLERAANLLPAQPDLILGCGDLPPEYLTELRKFYEVPLYFIQGNHDIRHNASPPVGCSDIHATIVKEQDLHILGFKGSRWYNGEANQFTEGEMKKIIRGLWFRRFWSRRPDIIISHAPPRFIHDQEDPCHKGFRSFTALIKKWKPTWFLHGHIHELFNDPADRITTVCETQVINCYGYFFFDTEIAGQAAGS
ncbi:MAG: metallophosphoesterase [Thermodesulfobacteriota bacterium]